MGIGVVEEKQLARFPSARFTSDFDPAIAERHIEPEMNVDERLADTRMQRDVRARLHDREHREDQARHLAEQRGGPRTRGAVARHVIAVSFEDEALPFLVEGDVRVIR